MEVDDEPFDTNSPRNRFEKGSSGFNLQRADNAQCVTLQLTTHLKLTSAARDSSNFRRPEDASESVEEAIQKTRQSALEHGLQSDSHLKVVSNV